MHSHSAPAGTAVPTYVPIGALRFVLALLVFLGHALAQVAPQYQGLGLQSCGVAVFFIVSGYVILSAYHQFYSGAPGRFLVNRCLRIFPPYWLTYALALAAWKLAAPDLLHAKLSVSEFLGNWVLFGGYLGISHFTFVGHAWTIMVEMQFYLCCALLFAALGRVGGPRLLVRGFLLVSALAYGVVVATHGHARFYGGAQYAPFFALGAAAFALHARLLPRAEAMLAVLGFLGLSLHEYQYYIDHTFLSNPLRSQAQILFLAVTATFLWLSGRVAHGPAARLDKRIGDLTYHLYLGHVPVIELMVVTGVFVGWGGMAAALPLSLAVAWGLLVLSDKPVRLVRDRIRRRRLEA